MIHISFFFINSTIIYFSVLPSQDFVDTSAVSGNAIRTMAGNGMHLASGGFVMLMMALFVEDK